MAKLHGSDILIILRGLNAVSKAATALTEAEMKEAWTSSSLRPVVKSIIQSEKSQELRKQVHETAGRSWAVIKGLKEYSVIASRQMLSKNLASNFDYKSDGSKTDLGIEETMHTTPNEGATHGQSSPPNARISNDFSGDADIASAKEPISISANESNEKFRETSYAWPVNADVGWKTHLPPETHNSEAIFRSLTKSEPYEEQSTSMTSPSKEGTSLLKESPFKAPKDVSHQCVGVVFDSAPSPTRDDVTSELGSSPSLTAAIGGTEEGKQSSGGSVQSDLSFDHNKTDSDKPVASQIEAEPSAVSAATSNPSSVMEEPTDKSVPTPVVRKKLPKLSETARENTVPASRISRLASYGSLAAGLGFGALAEVTRRTLGLSNKSSNGVESAFDTNNPFLTEANAERIVNTLCKVRGAALKLGQMLSIQDSTLVNPQLLKIFERVRQSADFMPAKQMEKVLNEELGPDWRSQMKEFNEKPFAAASVGQVHYGVLHDGREVAMKIQYPGVAKGIESDINNLVGVMKVWNILPEGLFINEFIEVAKRELSWEVDYAREAEATKRFKSLLKDDPNYKVPDVIDELCSKQVFTTEFVEGVSMEQCMEMDQDTRNEVAEKILKLCLMELFDFQYMQTDPNWANFMFNLDTRQLVLLDFGASREYPKPFVNNYLRVLEGAAENDRQKVLEYSQALGFLSGFEAKSMEDAHIDAVMILGEAFRCNGPFDFGKQDTTRRIQKLVPVMLNQRLRPPPEESYSLHRKMSGAFLLCAKLGAQVNCRRFFDEIVTRYHAANFQK